jgi:hypothetical protein
MVKISKLILVPALVLAFNTVAQADDAALAAKLVGNWEGRWEFESMGGKLIAKITASSGNSLKGETTWFDTAVGDFKDRFSTAKVKDGRLKVVEQTMDFEVTVSEDGSTMAGTWTSPAGSGPMQLKKQVD